MQALAIALGTIMCRGAEGFAPALSRLGVLLAGSSVPVGATGAAAQQAEESEPAADPADDDEVIIVIGLRGSAIKNIAPLATLDEDAIAATGATTMSELLKVVGPVTKSADGSEPILLLNGQRIASHQEVGTLPPEAIEKMEVLPEPEALRFGYPPTRRILNFITKRQFQQTEVTVAAGSTTRRGSMIGNINLGITRLQNDARFSLNLEHKRTGSILQSERDILPDPDVLFDGVGNITGVNGGEIDPALSALAGQIVTVAPVPEPPAGQVSLSAVASGANFPRFFDLGPYKTLSPLNDTYKAEATWGDRRRARFDL